MGVPTYECARSQRGARTVMLAAVLHLLVAAVAFPLGDEWVIVDANAGELARFSVLDGLRPRNLTVAPDGSYVFTAVAPAEQQPALWVMRNEKAFRLGHATGAHSFPAVSSDGRTIFFSYHADPQLMGPERGYTQLWRVEVDGTGLTQLTSSFGCKLTPAPAQGSLYFAHAQCGRHQQGLSRLSGPDSRETQVLPPTDDYPIEPQVSPDGRRLAMGLLTATTMEVRIASSASPKRWRTVWSGERFGKALSLRWLNNDECMFVHQGRLVRIKATEGAGKGAAR